MLFRSIVKSSESFAAPASGGLTRPDGNTGSYFMWLGSDGKLYAPGTSVPADVTKLTAQFALSEQFSLKPGDTYYFDLSGEDIPGTTNSGNSDGAVSLPDTSLHYVPFTYAGTVNAYKLTSAMATTEIYTSFYTLSLPTLFRSSKLRRELGNVRRNTGTGRVELAVAAKPHKVKIGRAHV